MDFTNKVIIVTGASKGIGKCLCETLVNYGTIVIGVYNKTKITNQNIDTYKCDIKNELEIKNLYKYVIDKYNHIDALINCAAITIDNDLYEVKKEDFMKVLEVNLVGTFLMIREASLHMNNGVIINVSSSDAFDTFSVYSMDYAASKAGLNNITKNLANRLPNLKICGLAPGWVDTETVLKMDPEYLKNELKRVNQSELIKKEVVVIKIIEMLVSSDYVSGDIVRVNSNNE